MDYVQSLKTNISLFSCGVFLPRRPGPEKFLTDDVNLQGSENCL